MPKQLKKRSLNDLHKTEVVQEACSVVFRLSSLWMGVWFIAVRADVKKFSRTVQFNWKKGEETSIIRDSFWTDYIWCGWGMPGFSGYSDSHQIFIFYNVEFDPGSGWTLATGLTHASRGAAWGSNTLMATGARVSNAYPTFPLLRDNPLKDGLIPYDIVRWHQKTIKGQR